MATSSFHQKVNFILEIGRALHEYGAAAHHIERALNKMAKCLGIGSQFISLPTGILASFAAEDMQESDIIRVQPGSINLSKLCCIDEIADGVINGQLTMDEGSAQIQTLKTANEHYPPLVMAVGYALASGGMAGSLHGSVMDLLVAFVIGLVIGGIDYGTRRFPVLGPIFSPITALIATIITMFLSHYLPGLSPDIIILSSIIALIPGIDLVLAFVEISTKNLVAGTARLAGATAELVKIAFTILLSKKLISMLDQPPVVPILASISPAVGFGAVLALIFGYIILFRVRPRNALSAFMVSIAAYYIAQHLSAGLGSELAFFVAAAFVAAVSNMIARFAGRPGLVTLLPGIVLMVPGSIGYRGLSAMFQYAVMDTVNTIFSVVIIAVSIVAGLSFGNTIFPPRRSL